MKSNCNQNRSNLSIIFCPILPTEFLVKFHGKFRGLSFRNFKNKDPSLLVFIITKTKTPHKTNP